MCLSLPAKVLKVDGDMAEVSVGGTVFRAGVQMVDGVRPGDWVLLHAGFAIGMMKEEEALETLRLLDEIGEAGSGAGYTGIQPGMRTEDTDDTDGTGGSLTGR